MAKVLVVDDEEPVRRVLRAGLELAGHAVLEAANGFEALRLCREHHFDLVLTDISMPGKDGLELIADLRREFPEVKLAAMSASGLGVQDVLELARASGARRSFRKPFSISELLRDLKALLEEQT